MLVQTAIWHRDSGQVFIARDRLGIKPHYYFKDSDNFRFASSLSALLANGDIRTPDDLEAVILTDRQTILGKCYHGFLHQSDRDVIQIKT